jgi:hypothetical protein
MSTEARETVDLIGSDKVEGTAVYRSNGEKVGQIERDGKRLYRYRASDVRIAYIVFDGNSSSPPWWAMLSRARSWIQRLPVPSPAAVGGDSTPRGSVAAAGLSHRPR